MTKEAELVILNKIEYLLSRIGELKQEITGLEQHRNRLLSIKTHSFQKLKRLGETASS